MPNLDIQAGITTAILIALVLMILYIIGGIRSISASRHLTFYRKRQEGMVRGWRMIIGGILAAVAAFAVQSYGQPLAYTIFPPSPTASPSPTITQTPTITPTPSITLTPTITETPSETDTPTPTATPHVPEAISSQFEGLVTPRPEAIFSPLIITEGLTNDYEAINAAEIFENPLGHMFALFSYNNLDDGVQWTALWYRDSTLVHYETLVWEGGSGGLGYTDWNPPAEEWLPGSYQIQIFLGRELKAVGSFLLEGDPPIPTETATATPTITTTPTPSPTRTLWPTQTRTVTPTATKTRTVTPTNTPRPTFTATLTPTATITRWPTSTEITPSPTITRHPTSTEVP